VGNRSMLQVVPPKVPAPTEEIKGSASP